MIFNENWTKEDNDILRQMNIDKKSHDEIINFFGYPKLKHHPTKFKYGGYLPYEQFINEIKIVPETIFYNVSHKKSQLNNNEYDYMLSFEINNHQYIINLIYLFYENIESYIISFTTNEQYIKYNIEMSKMLEEKDILLKDDIFKLTEIFEESTNYNELFKVIKSISYILFSFSPTISHWNPNALLSIVEGKDKRKIKLYRNIIEDSFKNIIETSSVSPDGMGIFYYKITR